jgi:flagellar protein FlaG
MSFEIGPISSAGIPTGPVRRVPPRADFQATLAGAGGADVARVGVPATPPPQVLDAIGAAADRVDELAAQQRELHFERDEHTGRVIVQVRDLATREVIRTIPPSEALAALTGGTF